MSFAFLYSPRVFACARDCTARCAREQQRRRRKSRAVHWFCKNFRWRERGLHLSHEALTASVVKRIRFFWGHRGFVSPFFSSWDWEEKEGEALMKKMSNMSDNGEMAKDFMGLGDTSSRETEAVIVGIERSSCNGAAASLGGLENNLIEKGGRRGGGEGTARAATATKPSEELAATDIQQLSREDCWRLILEAGTCISGNFLSQTCACRKKLLEPELLDNRFLTLPTRTSGALEYGGLAIDLSKVQLLDGFWLVVFSRCAGMQWPSCDTAFRLQSQVNKKPDSKLACLKDGIF